MVFVFATTIMKLLDTRDVVLIADAFLSQLTAICGIIGAFRRFLQMQMSIVTLHEKLYPHSNASL